MKGRSFFYSWLPSFAGYTAVTMSSHHDDTTPAGLHLFQQEECQGQENTVQTRFARRHVLILLFFLGFACVYAMRVNLSVAIVGMVKAQPRRTLADALSEDQCPMPVSQKNKSLSSRNELSGQFDWDEETQGMMLGSFFYGYLLTNYLGGRLADRLGGRLIFGMGVALTGILTVISPLAAQHSTGAFMLIRVLEGMTEGVTFPSMNVMASHWIPPQERARSLTRMVGGCPFGTVLTLSVSGWLIQTEWGWPSVFYISGIISLVWSWFWFKYTYDTPDLHPTITTAEKLYIKQGIGDHRGKMGLEVPWRSIMTSGPFLVVIVAHIGHNWGFYCLLTELPTYLKNIQHFDMKQNGLLSAAPYFVLWLFSLVYSTYMDHLLVKRKLTTRQIRKLSMVVANYIPMLTLLLVPWAGCNGELAVTLICVAVGTTGATVCGMHCAFQELAPNFSGTLTGISNTLATIPGFVAPAVTGIIINNQQTLSRWKLVFQLVSLVYLFACTLYLVFMSADIQPWNDVTEKRKGQLKENVELKTI